jgi:hypothetical protein
MKGAVCCDQNSGEVAAVTQIGETIEECGELALLRPVPIAPKQSKNVSKIGFHGQRTAWDGSTGIGGKKSEGSGEGEGTK